MSTFPGVLLQVTHVLQRRSPRFSEYMQTSWNAETREQRNSRSGTVQADPGCICINHYSVHRLEACRIFSTAAVMVGSDGEQTTSVVGLGGGGVQRVCQQGKGNSHQFAHVIIITCFPQLERVSRWVIFLPKRTWKRLKTQSSLKPLTLRCVYSMSVDSQRWTIPIAADLSSWTRTPLRLQTEELKCWGLPFFLFFFFGLQVREILNVTISSRAEIRI